MCAFLSHHAFWGLGKQQQCLFGDCAEVSVGVAPSAVCPRRAFSRWPVASFSFLQQPFTYACCGNVCELFPLFALSAVTCAWQLSLYYVQGL